MKYLGFDVGTTKIKCGIYDENGKFVYYDSVNYGVKQLNREEYIDITKIKDCAIILLQKAYKACPFDSISVSSLGESFVLLDENDNVLFLPMLYTNPRGKEQAENFNSHSEKIFKISGVSPQSMYSAYKLMWIKENAPEIYRKAKKLFLVGEYINYVLTGKRLVDYSLISRTGLFDIEKKEISSVLCELFGVDKNLFSPVAELGSIVGNVKEEIIQGGKNITVVLGGHDQVCCSIGAGVIDTTTCADGLGTVECVTAVYEQAYKNIEMGNQGYPNVPYLGKELYCTYMLNYSCSSLTNWWLKNIAYSEKDGDVHELAEKEFTANPTGLLVMPYFAGAATPYQNIEAKGGIINLTLSDSKSKIYQGILEGLSYENKLNLETVKKYGIKPQKIIATGGGSNSEKWLQIKANILNKKIFPLKVKEAGICGTAILGAVALTNKTLYEITKKFVKYGKVIKPNKEVVKEYKGIYKKYKTLYGTLIKYN